MAGHNKQKVSYREILSNPPMLPLLATRILDPVAQASIFAYMFSQLRWLNPEASEVEIATQAGLLTASKTAAKVCTNMLWGRLSDQPYGGRRMVLLIGLFSSGIATLGYGFATSFGAAIFWQVFNGAMSSSIGIIRCIVSEVETRPSHRSRALLLLPLAASTGKFLGPLLGGVLTTISAGRDDLLGRYPYALPNLVIAASYFISIIGCFLTVDETLETFDKSKGSGFVQTWQRLWSTVSCGRIKKRGYAVVPSEDTDIADDDNDGESDDTIVPEGDEPAKPHTLTFWEIWTPQVICTLTAHFIIAGHITTFNTAWSIFLASPVSDNHERSKGTPFFLFSGGIGLDPAQIGALSSVFALLSIALQTTLPWLTDRFGALSVWRTSLFFFPFGYLAAPFSALVASTGSDPTPTSSSSSPSSNMTAAAVATWASLAAVNLLVILGATGAQPAMTLLLNNSVPAPSARGTINVAGTVVGNLSRSLFPVAFLALYGWGYDHRFVAAGFWAMALLSVVAIASSKWVRMKPEPETETEPRLESEPGAVSGGVPEAVPGPIPEEGPEPEPVLAIATGGTVDEERAVRRT